MYVKRQTGFVSFVQRPRIHTPGDSLRSRAFDFQANTLRIELSTIERVRTSTRKCDMEGDNFVAEYIFTRRKLRWNSYGPVIDIVSREIVISNNRTYQDPLFAIISSVAQYPSV